MVDPFAEKKKPWPVYALVALLLVASVGWYIGQLDAYLPTKVRSTVVLGDSAPANFGKAKERAVEAEAKPAEAVAAAESE